MSHRSIAPALLAAALLAPAAASAELPPDLEIHFDARQPFARPMVFARAFGRPQLMLLDTGSSAHFLARAPVEEAPPLAPVGIDYTNRPIFAFRTWADASLPGWGPLGDGSILVSEWADINRARALAAPRTDGILSPQLLARPGLAVVMDLPRGLLSVRPFSEALPPAAPGDLDLSAAPIYATDDLKFVVIATVGGQAVRMALDTGAPHSLLYQPRGDDLPDGLIRQRQRHARVRVGQVEASLDLDLLEPLATKSIAPFDGLLGMDVLRSCTLAFDRDQLLARCREGGALRAARGTLIHAEPGGLAWVSVGPAPTRRALVRAGAEGPWLREMPTGGYEWIGRTTYARIHRDGTVRYTSLPASGTQEHLTDDRSERQRFADETLDLRVALAQRYDRELVAQSLEWLPGHLASVWGDPTLSPSDRRRVLFAIWDQAAEPNDPERGGAGRRARGLIDGFVRSHLPAGTPDGYSLDEIARMNATRPSGPRFDPYQPPAPHDRGG